MYSDHALGLPGYKEELIKNIQKAKLEIERDKTTIQNKEQEILEFKKELKQLE